MVFKSIIWVGLGLGLGFVMILLHTSMISRNYIPLLDRIIYSIVEVFKISLIWSFKTIINVFKSGSSAVAKRIMAPCVRPV